MLVVMEHTATEDQILKVCQVIRSLGLEAHKMPGAQRTAVCITGNDGSVSKRHFAGLFGIREIIRVSKPYKLTSNEVKTTPTVVKVKNVEIGSGKFEWIAGPPCIENLEQDLLLAEKLAAKGVRILRASAFRPRSNPYNFQGLGQEGLNILATIKDRTQLAIAVEVMDVSSAQMTSEVADLLIIDSHNMQNFALLKAVSKYNIPIMLKRGIAATIEDWLMAAEYIMSGGNHQVILCEAGVCGLGDHAELTLDLAVVPALQKITHLPIVVDPSQAAGTHYLVAPLAKAAQAVGAHGVMMEVHVDPANAKVGGAQALAFEEAQEILSSTN